VLSCVGNRLETGPNSVQGVVPTVYIFILILRGKRPEGLICQISKRRRKTGKKKKKKKKII
jgi:hypothetical protein